MRFSVPEIAQDVMQESFIKAWRFGPNYDPSKGRLYTWLHRIVRNTAIDATRSASWNLNKKTSDVSLHTNLKGDSINTTHIGLRKLVDDLDPKYRILIDLI